MGDVITAPQRQRARRRLIVWFAITGVAALAIRLVAAWWWQSRLPVGHPFALGDSESYWALARTIARGQAYQFGGPDARIFRTPGYPLLLAPLFLLWGEAPPVLAARFWGAVWGVVSVGLCGWLAWEIQLPHRRDRAALGAIVLTTIYPGAIIMSVLVLSEVGFCPWMLGQLACWARLLRPCEPPSGARRTLWAGGAGLCAGAATLMRPSWLLFTPLLGGAYVLGGGVQRSRRAQDLAVMLAGLCLVMAPWWVRNYRLSGRWIPTTLQVGASLYDGLHPQATGASDMRFVPDFVRRQRAWDAEHPQAAQAGLYEQRLDASMKQAALAWARAHPRRVVELAWIKFGRMWNPLPNDGQLGNLWVNLAIAVGYLPLLAGMLAAIWIWGRRRFVVTLCAAPSLYFTLLHVVFVSSIRYRQPAMLAASALAASAAVHCWEQCIANNRRCASQR